MRSQLKFGVMHLQHNGHQFEVGLSRAVLRLGLEGCETKLGSNFGEHPLDRVEETNVASNSSGKAIGVQIAADSNGGTSAAVQGQADIGNTSVRQRSLSRINYPVRALPNNGWEVSAPTVKETVTPLIQGTALAGEKLCDLRRVSGGNRLALNGELQARKSDIEVVSKGGNRMMRGFSARQNRDALISIVVGRAIEREAALSGSSAHAETIVLSKCEISER